MPKGLSLHIGINYVDPAHYDGWDGELAGCENDARFYESLAADAGFQTNILLTNAATTAALSASLAGYAAALNSGDTFFLSYAGHGGSIPDLNGDEDDMKDETWLLHDRQFIDDELFAALQQFEPGVKLLLVSDSCHSGTVTRKAVVNGTDLTLRIDGKEITHKLIARKPPLKVIRNAYEQHKDLYDPVLNQGKAFPDDVASYVMLFAACQDDETAKEWGDSGLYTGTFRRVFESGHADYTALHKAIMREMPDIQTPKLFTYGNPRFDFSHESPFQLKGKPIVLKPDTKQAETSRAPDNADELIMHSSGTVSGTRDRSGKAVEDTSDQLRFTLRDAGTDEHGWDQAYKEYISRKSKGEGVVFVEPNLKNQPRRPSATVTRGRGILNNYLSNWPQPPRDENEFTWHLGDAYSQLKKAAEKTLEKTNGKAFVRIGHIDTGYLEHCSKPEKLLTNLGVSFVKDEFGRNKGIDKLNTGFPAEQDGHGCATLAILAGKPVTREDSYGNYEGAFGAVPFAEVIPIRICETVFNFFNANDVADGIDYAVDHGCEVITMSMAGYPTRRVAEAINRAYEHGVVVVTAAGNNWVKGMQKLTPKAVMYPARFDRVIAATGVCYNQEPYELASNSWFKSRSEGGEFMQGNYGPAHAMKTALAAYTPNLPWATCSSGEIKFLRSGGGTSSATPQVAAAAAIWIAYNREMIEKHGIGKSWKKVEAVRRALFRSAGKSYPGYKTFYGNGTLKAFDALENFNLDTELDTLKPAPEAKVSFGGFFQFAGQWFRSRTEADEQLKTLSDDKGLQDMIELEIVQLLYRDPELYEYSAVIDFEDEEGLDFLHDPEAKRKFFGKIAASPYASEFLKGILKTNETKG